MAQLATVRDRRTFQRFATPTGAARSGPVALRWVSGDGDQVRYALAVGRDLGTAVTRNRIRRQLRHLLADRRNELLAGDPGALLVRVGASGGPLDFASLGSHLDAALRHLGARRP